MGIQLNGKPIQRLNINSDSDSVNERTELTQYYLAINDHS